LTAQRIGWILVAGRGGGRLHRYYSLALREYLDFEPYLRVQREALKQGLSGGQA
jgi:hypothetical protein